MWKIILADRTELKGFTQNGNNYVSQEQIDESLFANNLATLTITNGEEKIVLHNAELIQQMQHDDGWYLCFRELTKQEMEAAALSAKIDYLAMMSEIDLEV